MKTKGWIKLHRTLLQDEIWALKPFGIGQAWVDLLLNTELQQTTRIFNDFAFELSTGEQVTSLGVLSQRWGWSTTKVRKFIENTQKTGSTTVKKHSKGMVISIQNWDRHQAKNRLNDTQKTGSIYKGIKEEKKKEEINSFEEKMRPNPRGMELIKNTLALKGVSLVN